MFIEFRKRICRRTATAQIDLPEPVIQLVQSLLLPKEAARTSLLSKSWHSAWLTRPNLDFDHTYFCQSDSYGYADDFYPKLMEFAEKTLERYENSNLKIDSFRLSMKTIKYYSYDRATKLVCRALKLGPTHLTIQSEGFDIPDEVFRYENLVSLTVLTSSPTLERLNINMEYDRVNLINVPSIRQLNFDCTSIPKLSVRSNSTRGWESRVTVTRCECLSALWFFKLNKFLNKLRFSRISLSLHVNSRTTYNYVPGEIRGLPTPEIENLDIYYEHLPILSCYALFDGLFRMCRPKVITQYVFGIDGASYFLGKILLDVWDVNVPMANHQLMYGLNDLKEARAQVFDRAISTWRDVTLESLLDVLYEYSTVDDDAEDNYYPSHRFQLNWETIAN